MNARMFVTVLYSILDLNSGDLKYSRAGHLQPILITHDGKIVDIPFSKGQPLGIFNSFLIDQQQITIPHGGLAMFFSDGLYEAYNSRGDAFGLERIKKLMISHRHEPARIICDKLWKAVQIHSGEIPHQDDFTVVIVKRE
jgi:sigma-B regulation protein RsbU (phosphoserine phosphatase)